LIITKLAILIKLRPVPPSKGCNNVHHIAGYFD
jgi:hypothetical protein